MARRVSKNEEFCIEYEEFCIKNKRFCIQNDEFCIKNDEFCQGSQAEAETEAEAAGE